MDSAYTCKSQCIYFGRYACLQNDNKPMFLEVQLLSSRHVCL